MKPRLENWSVQCRLTSLYDAPEAGYNVLVGKVYGHPTPRHFDGKLVQTSRILGINVEAREAVTKSREYELGKPNPGYVRWCKEHGYQLGEFL